MVDSGDKNRNSGLDERTLIKPYDDLEKSKASILSADAFPLVEVVHGPKLGAWFSLANQKEITLGRAPTNTIILDDNSVSRSHCVFQLRGGVYSVRDIGSRNGTFLNGQKIREEFELQHKDIVKVGIYTLRYLEEACAEPYVPIAKEPAKEAPKKEATLPAEEFPEISSQESQEEVNLEQETPVSEPSPEAPESIAEAEQGAESESGDEVAETPKKITQLEQEIKASTSNQALQESDVPLEAQAAKGKGKLLLIALLVVGVLVIGGGATAYFLGAFDGMIAYFQGSKKDSKSKPQDKPEDKPQNGSGIITTLDPKSGPKADSTEQVPVFIEVESELVTAKIFYKGKELGVTPLKAPEQVPLDQPQELTAEIYLDGINEKISAKQTFQVKQKDETVKVVFKPELGALSIKVLPSTGELYLEGTYAGQSGPAKAIKLAEIAYNTPIYLPYGEYVAEIRVPEKLEGSDSKVNPVRYRREFKISADQNSFEINASDQALSVFPANIDSTPNGAEIFVDDKKYGATPFAGDLPLGRHKLVLKKEGYNPFEKEYSIDLNTPFVQNYNLDTSPAGVYINKGRNLLKKGRYNDAIEQFAEALNRQPEASELSQTHLLLGEAFINTKTYDKALAYYKKAGENPLLASEAKLGEALALSGLGEKNQAILKVTEVFIQTKDPTIKSEAETIYTKISPTRSLIYVLSEPAGAEVLVGENAVPSKTPVILSDLVVGKYRIKVRKPGYQEFETRISLPIAAIKLVVVELKPEEP